MPQEVNNAFRDEKNKESNRPIMLYEFYFPAVTLYYAGYDVDVYYPTGGQKYTKFSIKHEGIATNLQGDINAVKVVVSNISRILGSLILSNNGLRGVKVVMKLVFADLLSDANANIADTFYIDSSEITENTVTFILTSKLDLFQVELPGRLFMRDACSWEFKKEGCWLWAGGVWTAPTSPVFLHADVQCDKTRRGPEGCEYHSNQLRFGAFPAIPQKGIYVV